MGISEFPSIRIDDFRQKYDEPSPEIGFLTHMHEDHTSGLARKSYYGPTVYCTAATRALILNFRPNNGKGELKYQHLRQEYCGKEILKAVELGTPHVFTLKEQTIEVTFIDANHCPGAAMILIKELSSPNNAVLFTGDLRCERWHLDTISRTPSIMPFLAQFGATSSISLYLDDTFQMHVNPFKEYPENRVGMQQLVNLVKRYPKEVHFCLADKTTGYEELLILLAQSLKTRVHMSGYTYNLYLSASDSSPLARKLLEISVQDPLHIDEARLHYCQQNPCCELRQPHSTMAYIKPCNQPVADVLDKQNKTLAVKDVRPEEMIPFEKDPRVFKGSSQRYFLNRSTKTYFPLFPWFHFSRHASFPELQRLADLFNVKCVKSIHGQILPQFSSNNHLNSKRDMVKHRIIPIFDDRIKVQQLRKRLQNMSSSTNSSSLDSEEENERHAAMMLLCQPQKRTRREESGNTEPSSLPSPPTSRPHSPVREHIDQFNTLVETLRNDPQVWFSLNLECLKSRE